MIWVLTGLIAALMLAALIRAGLRLHRESEEEASAKPPSAEAAAAVILAYHDAQNRYRSRMLRREINADVARTRRAVEQGPSSGNSGRPPRGRTWQ